MNKFFCDKSWSGNHSFMGGDDWQIAGMCPKCHFCGLILDTIDVKQFMVLFSENQKNNETIIKAKHESVHEFLGKMEMLKKESVRSYNDMGKKYCRKPIVAKLTESKIIFSRNT